VPRLRRPATRVRLGSAHLGGQELPADAVAGLRARSRHDRDRPLREQDQPMAPQDRLTIERVETPTETGTLLQVEGLSVAYGNHEVVRDASFGLRRGESLALIGESGSGKSTIARAVLRLLPQGGRANGVVEFDGQDILALSERRFRPLRGRRIGFVPQDPGSSLNAVRTIGSQAKEA